MISRGYLTIALAVLLTVSSAKADDPGIRDTLRYNCHNVFEPGTDSFGVPIYVYNDDSLFAISVVYCFESSRAIFSSASPGERLAAVSPAALIVNNRPAEKAFVLTWVGSEVHPIDPAAESWRFATIWFRTDSHWPCPEDLWLDTCKVTPGFSTTFIPLQGDEFTPHIWYSSWPGQCPLFVCMGTDDNGLSPVDSPQPLEIRLYPNPFNSGTVLEISTSRTGIITIEIFDILGRRIRSLVDNEYAAGEHAFAWDGRDDSGRQAASGVYFARVAALRSETTIKLVLLR